MKKEFLTILLFFSLTVLSQKSNVYVEYNLKISKEEGLFKDNEYLKSMVDNAVNNESPIIFTLEINKLGSKFIYNSIKRDSNDAINRFALSLGNYNGIVYNLNNDTILKQSSLLGNNIYISNKKNANWTLTNETKMIDNYLCYKATNVYTVVNKVKTFNHPVTAWYCPALPYPYGPNGYGNLPGLILELQVRNSNYGAKLIALDKKVTFDLSFLKNAKIMNEEELEKKLEELNHFDDQKK